MRNRIIAVLMIVFATIASAITVASATTAVIESPNFRDMAHDNETLYFLSGNILASSDASGTTQTVAVVPGAPKNIAIASSGMVYVTDESYDATSAWIWEVDATTGVSAKISYPLTLGEGGSYDVAVDKNGKIYVSSVGTDIDARTPIRTYDTSAGWEIRGSKRSALLSASSDGNFVAYAEKNPLLWYGGASYGFFLAEGGTWHGVSMPDDHNDVAISGSHEMAVQSPSGVLIDQGNYDYLPKKLPESTTAVAVSFDASGALYTAMADSTTIKVYSPVVVPDEPTVFVKTGTIDAGLIIPIGSKMEISEDGKMIFLGTSDNIYVIANTLSEVITPPPPNSPPVAYPQSVSTPMDQLVGITLTGSDPDGDTLIYGIIEQPTHGILMGTGFYRTYIPNAGYAGEDSFWFVVEDEQYFSVAKVSISVTPLPVLPPGLAQPNKAPSFLLAGKKIIVKTVRPKKLVRKKWAKDITNGPVRFVVTTNKPKLFAKKPAISAVGTLFLKPKKGRHGKVKVTVVAYRGNTKSLPKIFYIVLKKR